MEDNVQREEREDGRNIGGGGCENRRGARKEQKMREKKNGEGGM